MEEGQGIRAWKKLREPVSGLTHCVGALLAVAGMVALIVKAADPPRPGTSPPFPSLARA